MASGGALGRLNVMLGLDSAEFTSGLNKAEYQAKKSLDQIAATARRAELAFASLFGAVSVSAVFGRFINETIAAEQEQAQLAAVLKSTGQAAGYSRDQLNDMAAAMSATSTLSVGEINQAQTSLLAFTGIVGDQFKQALQSAIDMSARTGMTVVSAAETIGRALDVPSKGLAALSRQGFRFSDEQKKMAEHLEATGRTAEAQAIVLSALKESYGGAAEAARNTLGGSLRALQNQIGDLMTGDAGSVNGLTMAVNGLTDLLGSQQAKAAFNTFNTLIEDIGGMTATTVDEIAKLGKAINVVIAGAGAVTSMRSAITTLGASMVPFSGVGAEDVGVAVGAMDAAIKKSNAAVDALLDDSTKTNWQKWQDRMYESQWSRFTGAYDVPQLAPNTVRPPGKDKPTKTGKGPKRNILYDSIDDWLGSADGMSRLDDVRKTYDQLDELIGGRLANSQAKYNRELQSMGQGDWARRVNEELHSIEDKYQDLMEQRRNSAAGLSEQDSAAFRDAMEREKQLAIQHYDDLKRIQGDWLLGAQDALINYSDQAANVYQNVGTVAQVAFGGMADALTDFVMTGKADFADLANSIIKDMIRMQIQASITGPLAGALGGALSGWFGGTPMTSTPYGDVGTGGWFQYDTGGFTGPGGKYEPAGIVHKGEYVLNQDATRRIGVGVLDRVNKGYANGGLVGGSAGGAGAVSAPVVNITNTGTPQAAQGQPRIRTDEMGRAVIDIVLGDIQKNGRLGQTLRRGL